MRVSSWPYAVGYAAYHVADLATLGLVSDASWYWGATHRSENPMGAVRAVGGFAATAAVKSSAAYALGVFNALGSTWTATAAATGLATRAGRWAYDWVDSAVAWAGQDSEIAKGYESVVLGETIKSTGLVPVTNGGVRTDANTLMGESASKHAGRFRKSSPSSHHHYEWLHLLGRSLGGGMDQNNFVAGSFHANTEMIPLENAIREASDKGANMQVNITAFCVSGTHIANRINYKVFKAGSKVFEKTFDANRGPVSSVENELLKNAAESAIQGGWWGSLRRYVGPR